MLIVALYVVGLCLIAYCAILYAHNKHSWKDHQFYQSLNIKDTSDAKNSANYKENGRI